MSTHFLALITGITLAAEACMAGVVATGTFQSKEAGLVAGGSFEIQEYAGKLSLVLQGDFKVSEGPDLYFAFHPLAAASITGNNAKTGALRVDPMLRSLYGAQTYALPSGLDPAQYKSIVIHCWKFNHLYAAATLKLAAPSAVPKGLEAKGVKTGKTEGPSLRRDGGRLVTQANGSGSGKGVGKPVDIAGRTAILREGRKAR